MSLLSVLRLRQPSGSPIIQFPASGGGLPGGDGWDVVAAVEAALEHLVRGSYNDAPQDGHPLLKKICEVAIALQARDKEALVQTVALSMDINESVSTAVSKMTRDMRAVDDHAETISAAAGEMVATVSSIADNADRGVKKAREAQDAAHEGIVSSQEAVEAIEKIVSAITDATRQVNALAEASTKIGQIVEQIEAIAKQTNLLALNATIEAARAGDAGKGFAVVATEVKTLANQTARATDDIRTRISGLRSDMGAIVNTMRTGGDLVAAGQTAVRAGAERVQALFDSMRTMTAMMEEIDGILHQQASASREISGGIITVARMAASNVAQVNELAQAMGSANLRTVPILDGLCARQIPDATIHRAMSDHVIWRKNLAEMALGRVKLNPLELADHHHCRLGKWYDAITDQGVRNHHAYLALEEPHRRVHEHGIKAAKLYNDSDLDGALAEIEMVKAASVDVLRLLRELAERNK